MLKKFIDKVALLAKLYLFKNNIKIEHWNESTYNWSQGYKKGFEKSIEIVEKFDEDIDEGAK